MTISLSPKEIEILKAIVSGATLKSHRYLDGRKAYRLHPLDAPASDVAGTLVASLQEKDLIATNHKFPASTFLLTEQGSLHAEELTANSQKPLTPSGW